MRFQNNVLEEKLMEKESQNDLLFQQLKMKSQQQSRFAASVQRRLEKLNPLFLDKQNEVFALWNNKIRKLAERLAQFKGLVKQRI